MAISQLTNRSLLSASEHTISALIEAPFVVDNPCVSLAELINNVPGLSEGERARRREVGRKVAGLSYGEAWSAAVLLALLQPAAMEAGLAAAWGNEGEKLDEAISRMQRVVTAQAERLKQLQEALKAARQAPAPAPAPGATTSNSTRGKSRRSEVARLRAAVAALQAKLKASQARARAAEHHAHQLQGQAAAEIIEAGREAIRSIESRVAAALGTLEGGRPPAPARAAQPPAGPQRRRRERPAKAKAPIPCAQCGDVFQPPGKANSRQRFCSSKCRNRFHKRGRARPGASVREVACLHCGAPFTTTLFKQIFCSEVCSRTHRLPAEQAIRGLINDWSGPDALPLLLQAVDADGLRPTARGLGVRATTLQEAIERLSRPAGDARPPVPPQTEPPP